MSIKVCMSQYVLSLHSARSSRDPPRGLGFLKLGPISHCIASGFGVSDDAKDTILNLRRQLEQQHGCLVVEGVSQSQKDERPCRSFERRPGSRLLRASQ